MGKKNIFIFGALMLLMILSMSSCATLFTSGSKKVTVNGNISEPVTLRVDDKVYPNVILPYKVGVKRSRKSAVISAESPNYVADKIFVSKKLNVFPFIVGNVMMTGLVGMIVDISTGKAYTTERSDYNMFFEPLAKDNTRVQTAYTNQTVTAPVETPLLPPSDIAVNIPVRNEVNNNTFVVIIANEDYKSESNVPFAIRDGEVFREYCLKTIGVPAENIDFFKNATYNELRRAVRNVQQFSSAFGAKSKIIFYYAGHGIPDESSQSAYLLPVDGYGSDPSTGYKVDDLFNALGALNVEDVTVFMDACFSGTKRDGEMMASARGVAIKTKENTSRGKMVVFSAATGDETAYPYTEKGHGLFTYYLLKKLQESKGNATYEELFDYVQTNVKERSFTINRKMQTPTINVAPAVTNVWKKKKF